MLVLSRRAGDKTYLVDGDTEIMVEVVSVQGNKVRLGFIAPKHVKIERDDMRKGVNDASSQDS